MSYVGKKPGFKQVRTNEIVVPKGTDITTAGVIVALDVSNISFVKLTAATELQGIVAPESPAIDGKLVTITNASSADLLISNESGGASANNRIVTGTSRNMRITAEASFTATYDVGSSRWRVTATSADVNIGRLDVGVGTLVLDSEDISLASGNLNSSLIEVTAGTAAKIRSVDTQNTGNLIVFTNKTGQIFQIKNEDTDVLIEEKRIRTGTGGPILIQNNASVMLGYISNRWHVVGGTGSGGGATEQVTQPGLGDLLTHPVGTPLYVDVATGLWTKASAVSADTAEIAGLIVRSLNTDFAEVALAGEVSEVTADAFVEAALPPKGSVVFLSTTAGQLTVSDVTTIGYVSKPIGIVHNVNGTSSVDVMFYNLRGVVVGSVNARSQILLGGSPSAPVVTPIQNVSQYEAGELAGWITINADTDYQFYFQTQFAKIPNTSNYSIAVPQTVGSTPPAGFSMDVVSGVVQVTLPALAGFVSAYVNFALNAPAVGATLPLSINSTNVYTSYKTVSGVYSIVPTDDLIYATGASAYSITLPTAVGALGKSYTIKSDLNADLFLTVSTTGGELIDSSSSKVMLKGESLSVVSNGTKWVNLSAPVNEGRGVVPLGAVIAVGNIASWALPAAGAIKDGYALCNGQAFPSGSNTLFTGNMPNLSDERFLQGSSSVGGTGGANSKTLATAELPAHTHTMAHTHSIEHDHESATTNLAGFHSHSIVNPYNSGVNGYLTWNGGPGTLGGPELSTVLSPTDNAFMVGTDAAPSHAHTVDLSNFTGTSGAASNATTSSVGSGTAFDIRPQYFNVVYLMRVI